jgi:hypothetical protein
MGILPRIKGGKRWRLLSQHRLQEFERVFDKYVKGKTSAEHVSSRARKLKSIRRARQRRK